MISMFYVDLIVGFVGSLGRSILQVANHGVPEEKEYVQHLAKWMLGVLGGYITWELTHAPVEAVQMVLPEWVPQLILLERLLALALGFFIPDVLENLMRFFIKYTGNK